MSHHRKLLISIAASAATGLVGANATAASLAFKPKPKQAYRIVSLDTQLVVDVEGISLDAGANIHGWGYNKTANQIWTFKKSPTGYQVVSANSGLCLAARGKATTAGTPMEQAKCSKMGFDKWRIDPTTPGAYRLTNVGSNECLDLKDDNAAFGTPIQQWDCSGAGAQSWLIQALDANGDPIGGGGGSSNFGNMTLHPEKIGFYMVPDIDPAYKNTDNAQSGWCPWTKTQASLIKLQQLLPNAWIRWDNETGHNSDDPQSVSTFVSCANTAKVGMIITATAFDGYNNWWANGGRTPNASLIDFGNSAYVGFAVQLANSNPVVKFVETANEPDGPWFNSDGDNVGDFNYYLQKLTDAFGGDKSRILGPSVASVGSNIWNSYQGGASNLSYHTYGGANSLQDFGGKNSYVTEYGGFNLDPGAVLADLYTAETQGKLSGGIQKLFYQQITDNGSNRGAFNHNATEGNHYALRDWFRALVLYQSLGNVSSKGYADTGTPDFLASDNGSGDFSVLYWNNGGGTVSGQTRVVPATSVQPGRALNVVHVGVGDANTASCAPLASQNWVGAQVVAGQVSLAVNNVEPHAAVLVTTASCTDLAN